MDARQRVVLLAERNRDARERLTAALETSFDVSACEFGEDVLRRLRNLRPNVLILGAPIYVDIGSSRRHLLQELLWRGFRDIARRTIILTGHPLDPDLIGRAREARVFAVVLRPVDMETITGLAEACAARSPDDDSTRWIGIDPPAHGDGGRGFEPRKTQPDL